MKTGRQDWLKELGSCSRGWWQENFDLAWFWPML